MIRKILFFVIAFNLSCQCAYAWGPHSEITSTALNVLNLAILTWLGTEAVRWIRFYCKFPDLNWARFGEVVSGAEEFGEGAVRFPDTRRDWDISRYCEFDEVTGQGQFYVHGPRIGTEIPDDRDERSRISSENEMFAEEAVRHFFKRAVDTLQEGSFQDGIRYAGNSKMRDRICNRSIYLEKI